MVGEVNLARLLADMSPSLSEAEFVFYSSDELDWNTIAQLDPKSVFIEEEGISLILAVDNARHLSLDDDTTYKCITLNVHSSLEAVGLTAAVSHALTQANISANVVAAYYHDHIFVNASDANRALEVLNQLSDAQ
ncbi:ACT domain-containing protein [Aliiglaciecola sp. LCG003]|nr:ACT domain-containing protein [Aliiglaciecola sp. LCG003]WJG11295.1 ACT domain-containing protein [Aliiglaciecola sp. LCG003]